MLLIMLNLSNKEGLLVGSSSGAALQGALELKSIQNGVIVTIFQMEAIDTCPNKYSTIRRVLIMNKTQMIHGDIRQTTILEQ